MQQINNLQAKITKYEKQIRLSVNRVIDNGWFVLGPEVKQFEQRFATYLSVAHCVSVASGTDAIELSLRAMGVSAGDKVATVANAGMYTTTAILAINADPIFMDVDFESRNVTLAEVKQAVDKGAKAIVVTHLFGLAVSEIQQIADYCFRKDIPLLEDCAQAHGAVVKGRHIGSFGNAACFSFYPTKNLGGLGDGGAVATNNEDLAQKVSLLRQYGWTEKYKVEVSGARNSRLDEIQAAILSDLLPTLDEANQRRRDIATRYSEDIVHPDIRLPKLGTTDFVAHLYVIRCKQRPALQKHLHNLEIATDIHYPIPDYRQPLFGGRFASVNLENTETLANEILTLPCYPEMNDQEVGLVTKAINSWLQ